MGTVQPFGSSGNWERARRAALIGRRRIRGVAVREESATMEVPKTRLGQLHLWLQRCCSLSWGGGVSDHVGGCALKAPIRPV